MVSIHQVFVQGREPLFKGERPLSRGSVQGRALCLREGVSVQAKRVSIQRRGLCSGGLCSGEGGLCSGEGVSVQGRGL